MRCTKLAALLGFGVAFGAIGFDRAEAAPSHVVCVDHSSPSATVDRAVALAAARTMHAAIAVHDYDGSPGMSERNFRTLAKTECELILGIPVDLENPDPPDGLALTIPYARTGYVIAARQRATQAAALHRGERVAVGTATAPNFFLAGAFGKAPPVVADTFTSQEEALDALVHRDDDVAMVWQPSLIRFRAAHPGATLIASRLAIPHNRWTIAALYAPRSAPFARRFNTALHALSAGGVLERLTQAFRTESLS